MKFNYKEKVNVIDTEKEKQIVTFIEDLGFSRISDVFLLPKNVQNKRSCLNRQIIKLDHLRYPISVQVQERDYGLREYYVRSFGGDFNIVKFKWYETWEKPLKIYSSGCGVYNNCEVEHLVLAQAFGDIASLKDLQAKLNNKISPFSEIKSTLAKEFDADCLRVWGVLDGEI
jgi:hypothetical protein